MKNLISVLFVTLLSLFALAKQGDGGGVHGGNGIYLNNQLYLIDLVQLGVHRDPHFKDRHDYSGEFADAIANKIKLDQRKLDINIARLVAAKFREIESVSPAFAERLKTTLFRLGWSTAGSGGAMDERTPRVPLATRVLGLVIVNVPNWNKLDDENKSALIFHEIVYELLQRGKSESYLTQTKIIVGTLYSSRFSRMSRKDADEFFASIGVDEIFNH